MKRHHKTAEDFIKLSSTYLIEELAVFACLQKDNPVFVYPGSITILGEIANKQHKNIPKELENLINVTLLLKPRTKK